MSPLVGCHAGIVGLDVALQLVQKCAVRRGWVRERLRPACVCHARNYARVSAVAQPMLMACVAKGFGLTGGSAPSRESTIADAFPEKRRRYLHFRGSKRRSKIRDCRKIGSVISCRAGQHLIFHRIPQRGSGRGVGARVHLEVAGNLAGRRCAAPTGEERRMAAHRVAALTVSSPSGRPCWMGLKENDRRSRCVRHDSNSSRATRKKHQQWLSVRNSGCPANPETKPRAKVRISREFRRNPDLTAPPIHTLATATDRIAVGFLFRARTAPAAIVPCLCRRWTAAA
jgi:hypothetical protein